MTPPLCTHDHGAPDDDWLPVFPSDWTCRYCGRVLTERDEECISCRIPREEAEKP